MNDKECGKKNRWEVRVFWPSLPNMKYQEFLDSMAAVHDGRWVQSDFGPIIPKRSKRKAKPVAFRSYIMSFPTRAGARAYAEAVSLALMTHQIKAGCELAVWRGKKLVVLEKKHPHEPNLSWAVKEK